jgi:hypothetical protein
LDPSTYKYLKEQEKEDAEKEINKLFKSNRRTQNVVYTQINSSPSQTDNNINKAANELELLAEMCGYNASSQPQKKTKTKSLTIKEEIGAYSSANKELDFSTFWSTKSNELPLLTSFVKKYCAIPASSVASESAFSIANYVQRKERSSLSSKNLRYSMILRESLKTFD